MATSQNGWTATSSSANMKPFKWITGRVHPETVEIFNDFCVWYNSNIEKITVAHSWGYAYRAIRGASTGLSNHASGTAIDLNAPKHPIGKANTFSSADQAKIRKKLKEYKGVIRWGGDYAGRKDDMHFEINASLSKVREVTKSLHNSNSVTPTTPAKPKPKPKPVDKPVDKTTKPVDKPSIAIKKVQTILKSMGLYKGLIDGVNGSMTKAAVKAYQAGQKYGNLYADGNWGSITQNHYAFTLKLQKALNAWKGTKLLVDGFYGASTAARVREWQLRNRGGSYRGVVDGVPGSMTKKALGI